MCTHIQIEYSILISGLLYHHRGIEYPIGSACGVYTQGHEVSVTLVAKKYPIAMYVGHTSLDSLLAQYIYWYIATVTLFIQSLTTISY